MIAEAVWSNWTTAQPGASDEDVPAWLAERRTGVTATEIRDLWLGKISPRQLAEEKLGRRPRRGGGNAYTEWGKRREPIIAELMRMHYGIEPEHRVWHAADNPRFLASPDGIAVGFDGLELAEIKTGKEGDGADALNAKGYRAQCAWQIRVLDADLCRYRYEGRLGEPGHFEPGATYEEVIRRDEVEWLIRELDQTAMVFLDTYDQIASEPFDGPVIDEELDTYAVNYLSAIEVEKEAAVAKKAAYDAILARMHEDFVQESPLARIGYTASKTKHVTVTDEDAAKAAHPDLWSAYEKAAAAWTAAAAKHTRTEETQSKATLRITAGK